MSHVGKITAQLGTNGHTIAFYSACWAFLPRNNTINIQIGTGMLLISDIEIIESPYFQVTQAAMTVCMGEV
mgnify:CR=1 FL=1